LTDASPAAGRSMFDLSGKTALVTGASRGLGRSLAVGIAAAGADVALAGREDAALAETAAQVEATGRTTSTHIADITSPAAVNALAGAAIARHGGIDILVNNAGVKVPQDAVDVTEQAWDDVMATNLKGAFFVAQAVGRHMVERGSGKIVNVASTYSVVTARGRTTYAVSKGGLLQMTRALAFEWAKAGVNVNAVGPTSIPTPMNDGLFADAAWREQAVARIPRGRFCTPEDVVGAVVFLASAASDMVTGQLLLIDGGLTVV
jgi:2-dehydro-3-deoxy-D-gluconate 5-dehydrogenase